ncbi:MULTISPECIES: hypothetical protein [unclassified Saccharopolyspora]|uniref:HAAS signaling domain-containing protein n=1 Tax=unclassified Saccharopolyspora TaxID=2646250 RepID=UPI001CD37031|nr:MULTISPECIES: hypothetical protein [unclassified Saccharopolyspora]MCA1186739.1 hypothetical protein [Saccharopolyspora sp. 6T]MCA1196216.1 hypothetical protein [Saccharopolyspora sp. 6V]MCA1278318.1 hypothetical protein [Saccharopolyspora sp. 7B]
MTKTHARVHSYLEELNDLLRDAPASVRRDVIAGVHEHFDASVGPDADAATVDDAIERMGTPEQVAAEAGVEPGRAQSARQGSVLAAALACLALAGACSLTYLIGGLMALSAGFDADPDWEINGATAAAAIVLSFAAWLCGTVLVAVNRSWSRRQKALLIASWPAALVLSELCNLPTGPLFAVNVISFVVQGVIGVLVVVALAKLWFATRS